MRLAILVSSAALALLTGCGSTPPPTADGAWFVSMVSDTGMCSVGDIMAKTGQITAQSKQGVKNDGDMFISIACSVVDNGDTTFSVQTQAIDTTPTTGSTLALEVLNLKSGATQANPSTGSVTFSNPQTSDVMYGSQACNFYFESKSEGVSAGQVWVSFDCPMITNGPAMSTCHVTDSVAIYENCATM